MKNEIEKKQKQRWNSHTLLIALCWLAYTCSYIGKVNYSANIIQIERAYNVLHGEAGLVSTFFFFAYGAGQIFNGLFSKRYNIKYVVFIGLVTSGLCNLALALKVPFEMLKFVWLVNGVALSVLWPCLIRLLAKCWKKKRLRVRWSLWERPLPRERSLYMA